MVNLKILIVVSPNSNFRVLERLAESYIDHYLGPSESAPAEFPHIHA